MIEAGQSINGYELIENIGKGGFGSVFRAYQANLGREVAVKIILPELANQPEFIRRFEVEGQLVARLENLHIVPLYDYWRDARGAFLVMRWLRGGNLKDALTTNPYNLQAASALLDQIAAGLTTAHGQNVIHRDIKPSNILLDEEGNAYLADFGIAKDLETRLGKENRSGGIIGSLDYLSPEQARSQPVTPQTDIYSLGVTLYEVLTGEHPFPNLSGVERLYKHINDPLPPIESLPHQVEDEVNRVIRKATAKNPRHRYEQVLAFAADFRQAAQLSEDGSTALIEALTFREQEILQEIITGKTNREIAEGLYIEISTVKWYIRQIYRKLDVRNRRQAILRASELSLLVSETSEESADADKSAISIALPAPVNPYKGLRPFATADAADFFGRDVFIEKLGRHFTASKTDASSSKGPNRFLAVVGPSGSGKSSLIQAGFVPRVINNDFPGTGNWFVARMTPGSRPLDELEVALIRLAVGTSDALRSQLERDEFGLQRASDIILPTDGSEVLLVIDQFEELFTLTTDPVERQQFLDLLTAAVTAPRSRLRLIISLRADFYDRPLQFPHFGALVRSHLETVLPLSAEELEKAIVQPAQRLGVTYEDGLVARIIDDVLYQPGALPLLQFTLTELFEHRDGFLLTQDAYDQVGGITGALARRAESLYQEYDETDQEKIRQLFLRLVTVDERQEAVPDTRRRVPRSELVSQAEDEDLVDDIIDTFAAYRLLTLDHNPVNRRPTVEVAHEALLREWERLREWLNTARDDIRQSRKVAHAADEWEEHNRDESYLLRGARLVQIEEWLELTDLVLTPHEKSYISESLRQRLQEEETQKAQKEREEQLERRSQKFLRGLVVTLAVATVLSAAFGIFALIQRNIANDTLADFERSSAEFRSIAIAFGAQDARNNGYPDSALALAAEAIRINNPPPEAAHVFSQIATSTWIKQRFLASDASIFDAAFHPDGQRVITSSWDGRAVVWDISTGAELQSIDTELGLLDIIIHPNSSLVAISAFQGGVLWDLETNEFSELSSELAGHLPKIFSGDGSTMITDSDNGVLTIVDTEALRILHSFRAHDAPIFAADLNEDESLLLTTSFDGTVKVWDMETYDLLQMRSTNFEGSPTRQSHFLADDEYVLVHDFSEVYLWQWRSDEVMWSLVNDSNSNDGFFSLDVSPDEQTFLLSFGVPDSIVQLRELQTGRLIHEYVGHTDRVQNIEYGPDGKHFVSASLDGTAISWPLRWEGAEKSIFLEAHYTLAWHPTRPIVATARNVDLREGVSIIRLVDTNTGAVLHELEGHRDSVNSLTFTPDGEYLVSGDFIFEGEDAAVYLWDVETGEQMAVLKENSGSSWINNIAISPDSHHGAFSLGNTGGTIAVWDLETGKHIRDLEGHPEDAESVIYSRDGQHLYSGGRDGSLYKWDVQTGEIVLEFVGHDSLIYQLDLIDDGSKLVSGSSDQTAIVWDTTTGEAQSSLIGHNDHVTDVAFSPDGRNIVTASNDGRIIVWDAATGQQYHTFVHGSDTPFLQIAFSPDGSQIATAANDILIIWDMSSLQSDYAQWVTENRFIPDFTCEQRELYIIEPLCDSE